MEVKTVRKASPATLLTTNSGSSPLPNTRRTTQKERSARNMKRKKKNTRSIVIAGQHSSFFDTHHTNTTIVAQNVPTYSTSPTPAATATCPSASIPIFPSFLFPKPYLLSKKTTTSEKIEEKKQEKIPTLISLSLSLSLFHSKRMSSKTKEGKRRRRGNAEDKVYRCTVCNVSFQNNALNRASHENGGRHKKAVEEQLKAQRALKQAQQSLDATAARLVDSHLKRQRTAAGPNPTTLDPSSSAPSSSSASSDQQQSRMGPEQQNGLLVVVDSKSKDHVVDEEKELVVSRVGRWEEVRSAVVAERVERGEKKGVGEMIPLTVILAGSSTTIEEQVQRHNKHEEEDETVGMMKEVVAQSEMAPGASVQFKAKAFANRKRMR